MNRSGLARGWAHYTTPAPRAAAGAISGISGPARNPGSGLPSNPLRRWPMSGDTLTKLLGENFIFVAGGIVAVMAILAGCIKSVVQSVTRERTRREIAAYIAEKSMTPEEGERLMAAGIHK